MDILKTPLVVLFKNQNPYRILENYFYNYTGKKFWHEKIEQKVFVNLLQEEDPQYSKDDANNIYYIVDEGMERKIRADHEKSVFNLLLNYSEDILENCGDAVRCRYKNLLKWRAVSLKLDQDLFICSFLAFQDIYMRKDRKYFDWDVIIKSNNIRLHNTLSKGMSENHFHLKGSAPNFKLSWVSLMNDIECRKLGDELEHLNRLEKDADGEVNIEECIVVAAIIRVILFKELHKEALEEDKTDELLTNMLKEIVSNTDENSKCYGVNKEFVSMHSRDINKEIRLLRYILGADLKHNSKKVKVDYAITKSIYTGDKSTELFSGERYFLYNCFKKIYMDEEGFKEKADLFYAYLILKNKIRAELIQENERVGFANFSDYQGRKCMYLKKKTILADSVEPLAILTSVKNQNLKSLEARVMPQYTSYANIKLIKDTDFRICNKIYNDQNNYWMREHLKDINDELIEEELSLSQKKILLTDDQLKEFNKINEALKDKYFYVYHFPKKKDNQYTKDELYKTIRCRHHSYRKELKATSIALEKMRENNQRMADRVLGIDACSNELDTRPEVYGQAFRFLKGHLPSDDYKREIFNEKSLQRLRATYHVGEDFLDVMDGLRAIDEAIQFLELTHGDRLGHALALGIDVREWYKSKSNRVYLSKQDVLDNIAWVISKIKAFNVKSAPDTIDRLISVFNKYYVEIYTDGDEDFSDETDRQDSFSSKLSVVPVDTYISAWKLRGDDPEVYLDNDSNQSDLGYWNRCAVRNRVSNKLVRELYRRYHYDPYVKSEGAKTVVFRIEPYMIEVIIEIQKCMQKYVRAKGIGVETNPSSNVLISTFKRYDKHPILNMYNIGLNDDSEDKKEVPQLFVSINTDDQGVFDTLLENEYALMAIALEKVKDENGESKYSQSEIYDWIDRVRQMGIDQSFRVIGNK
jgi:hypothetical protein